MTANRSLRHRDRAEASRSVLLQIDPALDFDLLKQICHRMPDGDPFMKSAAYVAMTGRKGLWLFGDDRAALLLCRHPNRDGQLLFFPPVGEGGARLIEEALCDPRLPSGDARLVRITHQQSELASALGAQPEREAVLDWAYPVHDVSTNAIAARTGGQFNNLRGHLHRAARGGLWWHELDVSRDGGMIAAVAERWAEGKAGQGFTQADLVGPTHACLSLLEHQVGQLGGIVVRDGQGAVGFWLWDRTSETAAVSLVRMSVGRHGAAELGAAAVAEVLASRGVSCLSLGGSETASLDQFKRKLGPVRSIDLKSADLGATRRAPPRRLGEGAVFLHI